ncbi:MAG: ABC transporter permease [Candidatus Eremiobacteraeota bacterium]|nr:ABC transporter permease [Candidatus Eremiobacteraeota bacterium]
MKDLQIVFVAEVTRKLRSRIFWIATVGGMAAIAFLVSAPAIFASLARSSSSDIVLAGPPALRARAQALMMAKKDYRVVATLDSLPPNVTPHFLDVHGDAGAAIAVSERGHALHLDIYPRDLSAFDDAEFRDLVPLNIELATNLSPARIESASTVPHTLHALDAKFADSRMAALAHGVAFGLIFILYLAIIIASQSVMSSVAEEKTSRIAEILVATIEPSMLLAGKTLAAAVVAMVQIALWLATAAVLLPYVAASLSGSIAAANAVSQPSAALLFDPWELVAFLVFFVLGYLQYSTIYAAAASLISRTEDLASVTTPVILPVVGAFFIAQFALIAPTAPVVIACSFVPLLSPFVMFTRIAVSTVPVWQIVLAIGIDAATVVASFWAAGKIYRVGMLLYGKLPSPKQIFAALRA